MAVSTKDVIDNYRLVLGNEPEPNMIAYYVQAFECVPALRRRLEFLAERRAQFLMESKRRLAKSPD
ncbi:MAG: hypothetical protein V7704_13665 [Aurantimonas endophytica]|uniref:hypothetical protein n=1 Tax=Aurantimonas endophytica TaxID=1522175 RepID=UPI0030023C0A